MVDLALAQKMKRIKTLKDSKDNIHLFTIPRDEHSTVAMCSKKGLSTLGSCGIFPFRYGNRLLYFILVTFKNKAIKHFFF